MKKVKLFVMFSLLLVSLFNLAGCGEKVKVIHISSKEDLLLLQDGGNFILDNDIDCEGMSLKAVQNFNGSIDGNGHKIHNVKFISENNCFGLIGGTIDSHYETNIIKNLAITDFLIDTNLASGNNELFIGGIIAFNRGTTIENCYVDGNILIDVNVKDVNIGGISGYINGITKIKNCYSNVDIKVEVNNSSFSSSTIDVGGLVGEGHNSKVTCENVLFTGSIDIDTSFTNSLLATVRAGGIYGYADGYNYIKYSLSTPEKIVCSAYFDKNVYLGALVGHMYEWQKCIEYSYWCDYYDETLSEEDKKIMCSLYSSKYYYGTNINLYKTNMLQENFMKGDYTFKDLNGDTKDSFLNFDSSIWNFGYMENEKFIYPSLKVFD